eukprot:4225646-Alexandrium_andersonii.AAC.1
MSASLVGSEMCIRDRAARAEEFRFTQPWQVWEARPITECRGRAGESPLGGWRVGHNKGDVADPNVRS